MINPINSLSEPIAENKILHLQSINSQRTLQKPTLIFFHVTHLYFCYIDTVVKLCSSPLYLQNLRCYLGVYITAQLFWQNITMQFLYRDTVLFQKNTNYFQCRTSVRLKGSQLGHNIITLVCGKMNHSILVKQLLLMYVIYYI